MVARYSPPHAELLRLSYGTIWSCCLQGDEGLVLVDVRSIESVVAMVPHPAPIVPRGDQIDVQGRVCVVEKPGLEVAHLGGVEEIIRDEENE